MMFIAHDVLWWEISWDFDTWLFEQLKEVPIKEPLDDSVRMLMMM